MDITARLNPGENLGDRILKVDHAGEHGAVNIYRGQALVSKWRAPAIVDELQAFQHHEEGHRKLFLIEMQRRGVRRCRSYHFCGVGGWLLGVSTGLLGPSAVAATTVAVESVVLRHLEAQLQCLRGPDPKAHASVEAIVHEEREHHDRAALISRQGTFWPRIITPIVRSSTEAVIWLGMRL